MTGRDEGGTVPQGPRRSLGRGGPRQPGGDRPKIQWLRLQIEKLHQCPGLGRAAVAQRKVPTKGLQDRVGGCRSIPEAEGPGARTTPHSSPGPMPRGGRFPESGGPRPGTPPLPAARCQVPEFGLMMFIRALLRLPLLGERTVAGGWVASAASPRSSISMVMTTLGGWGAPAPAPTVPSLPANRYFLSLRESPGAPLAFFSLTALVLRLWSSMA